MPPTTNYDIMDGKFGSGQAAMVINGRWAVQNYTSKKINFGVAHRPRSRTARPRRRSSVQMLGVNSRSKNTRAAWDLVRYLSLNLPLPLYRASGRVPATVAASKAKEVTRNPTPTQVVIASSNKGQPMPNIPEMGAVWTPAGAVLQLLVKGEVTAREAAVQMTNQIAKAISED